MANICNTTVQFQGDNIKLADLFAKLKIGMTDIDIAKAFDIPEPNSSNTSIVGIDSKARRIYQSDANIPHISLWNNIITKYYSDKVSFVYKAEEPITNLYINTDSSGKIFPEKFVINYYVNGYSDKVYFDSIHDIVIYCDTLFGLTARSVESVKSAMKAILKNNEYFTLGEFRKSGQD